MLHENIFFQRSKKSGLLLKIRISFFSRMIIRGLQIILKVLISLWLILIFLTIAGKTCFLISNCEHHINSNGSFSWWSAWLNKNENKIVIVPKNFMVNRYFKDIYPDNWIQLEESN